MELMSSGICSQFARISWTEERENAGPFMTSESQQSACHLTIDVRMMLALGCVLAAVTWRHDLDLAVILVVLH